MDGKRVGQFTIGGGLNSRGSADPPSVRRRPVCTTADEALQVRVPVKAGSRQVVATIVKSDDAEPEGAGPGSHSALEPRIRQSPTAPVAISSLLIGGPYEGQVPQDSPSRRLIFVCHPASAADETALRDEDSVDAGAARLSPAGDERRCARRCSAFYKRGRAAGRFRSGNSRRARARAGQSRFPVPHRGRSRRTRLRATVYRISDVELASRLSFFLWSSIPDDTLLDLAIRGRLHEPAVLEQQVSRMLADPRARTSLVQNFFAEWLQTRNVWLLKPENTKFPWFDDNLRIAFVREIELFLDAQLKEDHSIVDLLTSNETFLNEQLARHYGIPGVYGSHFRRGDAHR